MGLGKFVGLDQTSKQHALEISVLKRYKKYVLKRQNILAVLTS